MRAKADYVHGRSRQFSFARACDDLQRCYAYCSRGYISAKMAALPANSRAESGLKPCFRFRPWNGFLRVPFHIFQTLFKQSFLGLSQRIVLIKPLIGIELSELETNLLPLFLSELGQFLQNLGFAHHWNLTGQLGVVRMKIGLCILH
jgi:hypothetical protein